MTKRDTGRRSKKDPNNAKLASRPNALPAPEPGQTRSAERRVDVTGIMSEGIRVDPDITEGHPGYEESGDSEIIPPKKSEAAH